MKNYESFRNAGNNILRYGLAIILFTVGIIKFMPYEAEGIKPLVEHSPLFAWILTMTDIYGLSKILGVIEIILGVLIASRKFSAKACAAGSLGACFMFFLTMTFLLTTPGIIQPGYSFPFLSPMPGQFLAKDLLFFGAALMSAGEALQASSNINNMRN